MKTNELRIGNLYTSVKFKVPVECELTDLYDLCANADGATDHPPIDEMFEPIPLTEDWLMRFGFTYNDLNGDAGHWQIKNPTSPGFFQILQGEEGFCYDYGIYVTSVHQLQNLFFALSGEELVRKPEKPKNTDQKT